jgi:hypothetical protein
VHYLHPLLEYAELNFFLNFTDVNNELFAVIFKVSEKEKKSSGAKSDENG